MNAAAKLELARAAVEFAEAHFARERGGGSAPGWSASAHGWSRGGGDSPDPFIIGQRALAGEDVSQLLRDHPGVTASRAHRRMRDRLDVATARYKSARRAAGMPELVE